MKEEILHLQLTEEQALVLRDATELLARLGMGQFNHLDHLPFLNERRFASGAADPTAFEEATKALRDLYFPELTGHQFLGMTHEDVDERAKIAWDTYQVIRHAVAWHKTPTGGFTVSFDPPFKVSSTPLPTCTYATPGTEAPEKQTD